MAVALESPVFTPQQYYLIGYAQDSWRAVVAADARTRPAVRLLLSREGEANGLAKPFFVEDNAFSTDPDNFYNPDKNNISPRLSAAYELDEKTVLRGGIRAVLRAGTVRGPHSADRELHRAPARRRRRHPEQRSGVSVLSGALWAASCRFAATRTSGRTSTTCSTARACRANCPAQSTSPSVTPAARARTCSSAVSPIRSIRSTRAPAGAVSYGQIDYKTSGCLDGLVINGNAIDGLRLRHLQRAAAERDASLPGRASRAACSTSTRKTRGRRRARTKRRLRQNTFDYDTEYGTNPQDIPHTFNGSLIYQLPGEGLLRGGWRVGGIVNARSGVPINVIISRPDNTDRQRRDVINIPGGNSRGTAAAGSRPGRRSVSQQRRRALSQSGRVHDAPARHVRQHAAQLLSAARASRSST